MSLADELTQIERLHANGSLTDDEFARAKARLLGAPRADGPLVDRLNGLRRSLTDRWIGGVCGGLAQATGLATWFWRMLMTLLVLLGGTGLVAYLILWFFVPQESVVAPQLRAP